MLIQGLKGNEQFSEIVSQLANFMIEEDNFECPNEILRLTPL